MVSQLNSDLLILGMIVLCLILGVCLVMPIGGADMPVVVSLLNSYSGLAGAAAGFVLGNNGLIITGSLVGASGIILTSIMCKAMNRSLTNVLFGGSMATKAGISKSETMLSTKAKSKAPAPTAGDAADGAQKVIFVPGYGLAVAQAQHALLVSWAHAGRKRLRSKIRHSPRCRPYAWPYERTLAEARVPYDQLVEMDTINPEFCHHRRGRRLGRERRGKPCRFQRPRFTHLWRAHFGRTMRVLWLWLSVVLAPGFAGIPNELFIRDNTLMVSGDAKRFCKTPLQR